MVENRKAYLHRYYQAHKERYAQDVRRWRKANPDKVRTYNEKYWRSSVGRFKKCQAGATHQGLSWELTFDQFMTFWNNPCHYCGSAMDTVGFDRINNALGYSLANVVSCCTICNRAKRAMLYGSFIQWCNQMGMHRSQQEVMTR